MDLKRENSLRQEFRKILFDIAKDQEVLQDEKYRSGIYKRLEALYHSQKKENRFRHFYSDIFTVLTEIKNKDDQDENESVSIQILAENLHFIYTNYKPVNTDEYGNKIDISDQLRKLYDHANIDIARISYSDGEDRKISEQKAISDIKSKIHKIESDISKAEHNINEAKEELKNQQREYIAILGIFAAIVVTFISGIAFSTSVLQNINSVSPYRLIAITLIIGFVLINALFGLFFYTNILVNGKKDKSIKPLVFSNIIILILMALLLVSWCFGAIEYRNEKITNHEQTATVKQSITEKNAHLK